MNYKFFGNSVIYFIFSLAIIASLFGFFGKSWALGGDPPGLPGGATTTNFSLVLNPGWNLICLPVIEISSTTGQAIYYTAESFGQLVGANIVAKMDLNERYISHIVGLPLNNFDITLRMPIFVHVASQKTKLFIGRPILQESFLAVYSGWRPWGWTSVVSTTAANVEASVLRANMVVKFDSLNQKWVSHITGLPFNNFTINQGDGILIHEP